MNTRLCASLICGWLACVAGIARAADPAPAPAPAESATPISQAELLARLEQKDPDLLVLDVRTPEEFAAGHVPGARNVPHDQVPAKLAELASFKDKPVVLYCRSGRRSAAAGQTLRAAGFSQLLHLQGDWLAWEAEKKPVEK